MAINYSKRVLFDNHLRFWISLFVFLVCALYISQSPPINLLYLTGLFLTYCAFFGLGYIQAHKSQASALLHYSLLTVDVLAVSTAIHMTGVFQSPLYILYIAIFGVCIYHESLVSFVYTVVLSVCLYVGIIALSAPIEPIYSTQVAGKVLLMLVLTGVLYAVLQKMEKEKRVNARLVSHALVMGHIADVLSGSLSNAREAIRTVTRLIEEEMSTDGFKCRITIHRPGQTFFPPSGGRMGIHLPIVAGENIFGTMIITRETPTPLDSSEHNFFSSVARSLGLFLHRSQIWEQSQEHMSSHEETPVLAVEPAEPSGIFY